MAISALIVGLRAFGFFWFSGDLDSEFVIIVFLAVHCFDGGDGIILVNKDLSEGMVYDKSVVSDDSNFADGAVLTEEVFEVGFPGGFGEAPDIDLWIAHELRL